MILIALMVGAAVIALGVATRAPLATTVLGLIVFGVLHNVLEIRYVAGRFGGLLTGRFLALLLTLITGIVVCRVLAGWWPGPSRTAEIALGFAILAVGCRLGLRGVLLAISWILLAGAAVLALVFPGYYFVILAHLHNLVPLIFLWDWASRLPRRDRATFRAVQVGWVLVVPVLIMLGSVDRLIAADPGVVQRFVGDGSRVLAANAPPGIAEVWGLRFLVVFAFLQTMHYVVWVAFLPRFAPDAAAAFDARVPWLRGRRAWLLGLAGGAFLAVLFVSDYFQGRALYGAIATYHAYLEFPILLALIMGVAYAPAAGPGVVSPRSPAVPTPGR